MGESDEHEGVGANFIPDNYKLRFEPDFDSFKTSGSEEIHAVIKSQTDTILLNSKETKISRVTAVCGGRKIPGRARFLAEKERVELKFGEKIAGEVSLKIDFVIINNDGMYGFYRSRYEVAGKERYMLTTDLEPASARAVFPCVDEPEFKATFDVSVRIDKALDAISNMPKRSEEDVGGKKTVIFDTTPKMSTYLFYLGVGEFESTSDVLGKLKISIVTTPGKKKYTRLPLSYAKKFVKFFESYFGIKYPLPKLDLIAVPDFPMGAMENWGAITFRETRFLLKDGDDTGTRRDVAETIAHELAHQWFGDLVTMRWWNDTWLNESFATFMSFKAMNNVFPEWETDLKYVPYAFGFAFAADGLRNTHPISVKVNTAGETAEIFDVISYRKGGSVLRMICDYIGEDVFKNGLRAYLTENAYGNAVSSDLWGALENAGGGLPVDKIMTAWVEKEGYPVIDVAPTESGFRLSQRRFLFSEDVADRWPIPVEYRTEGSSAVHKILVTTDDYDLRIDENQKRGGWIKLNYGQNGLYRVVYDRANLEKLGESIKKGELPVDDAWGVENDLFSLVRAGRKPAREYLSFVSKYIDKPGYPLNENLFLHLRWLDNINQRKELSRAAREIGIKVGTGLLRRFGWAPKKNDSDDDKISRIEALDLLGYLKDKTTTKKALSIFKKMTEGKMFNTDIMHSVYSIAATNGNAKTFNALVELYNKTDSPVEKIFILRALGRFEGAALLLKALDFSLSKDVRPQDSYFVPAIAADFKNGRTILKWVKKNWGKLSSRYAPGTKLLSKFVEILAKLKDETSKKEFIDFFLGKTKSRDDIRNVVTQTLEKIELNIRYLKNN